jgi:DnaK suppressor protein
MTPAKRVPTKTSTARAARPATTRATKSVASKTAKATPQKKVAAKAPARNAATKAPAKTPAKTVKKSAPVTARAKAPAKTPAATPAKKAVVKAPVAKALPPKPAPKPVPKPKSSPYASDTKFLEEQKILLLEERLVYEGQAADLKAEADALAQEREPGDVQFDEESGEGGTVTVDRERDLAMAAQALLVVEEIDDALKRIANKTYGNCERCHQPIPKPRLRALPYARLCVACKSGGLSRR